MNKKTLARKIVEESIVLLKNEESLLPFPKEKQVAIFGRTQISTLFSGHGSGGANIAGCATILEECTKNGIIPEPLLKGFYTYKAKEEQVSEVDEFDWSKMNESMNSGIMYEIFGKYRAPLEEYDVPEFIIQQAAEKTDTALFVIGRNSGGEECDRHLFEDYYLTNAEYKLMTTVNSCFTKVAIVLNVNGLVDLSWLEEFNNVKSVVFLGIPGEEGASALAEVLTGKVNPSGKMAVTIAEEYKDYPSADHFSWNKDKPDEILTYEDYGLSSENNGSKGFTKSPVSVYWEGIYTGYRYFDSFGKKVLFPFGHGLSYTKFKISSGKVEKKAAGLEITILLENTGLVPGKEVVQIYLSKENSDDGEERPYQELKGFEKTALLSPGAKEQICICIPWRDLSIYMEETAAWMIEAGIYLLRVGNSSRNTKTMKKILVETDVYLEQCHNRLEIVPGNKDKLNFLTSKIYKKEKNQKEKTPKEYVGEILSIEEKDVPIPRPESLGNAEECTQEIAQRQPGKMIDSLSIEELAALCVGYGPGTPFAAVGDRSQPSTIYSENGEPLTTNSHSTGYEGYVSPAIENKGIKSVFYKDGPAGIGGTCWPTEMLIACAFNKKLWYDFGVAVGEECMEHKVDVWLAPAVNLHRNPLCGRNFEYFSEDPFLTGVCACEIARGVQTDKPVLVCPKHFAVNEQETFRRGDAKRNYDAVDSILTERTAREIYLKPFEMLVRDAKIACIMTSFNKINGVFAAANKDLCTHILREEWGFDGAAVTDWGDMDIVADGAEAVCAGNDIVMPGGPPVISQILKGWEEKRITREEMEKAVEHLLTMCYKVSEKR